VLIENGSMAGAFAVYEAKQAGLPITSDQIATDMAAGFNIGNWPIAFSAAELLEHLDNSPFQKRESWF
jgi:hypothetical protein